MGFFGYKSIYSVLSALGIAGLGTTVGVQQANLNRNNDEIQARDKKLQEQTSIVEEYQKIQAEFVDLTDTQMEGASHEDIKNHAIALKAQVSALKKTNAELVKKNGELETQMINLNKYYDSFEHFRAQECHQLKKHHKDSKWSAPTDMWARLYDYGKWTVAVKTYSGVVYKYWDGLSQDDKNRLVSFQEMKDFLHCIG